MIFGTPLDRYLDPGEKLLWSGQPKQGLRLQASDAVAIPFSIFWCAFVFLWEAMALGIPTGFGHHGSQVPRGASIVAWFFPLWGVPFILVGLYMLFGRFFFDAARRKRTWYGITDRRLIVYQVMVSSNVTSFDFATLTNLQLVERKDNSGDVLFGLPGPMAAFGNAGSPQSRRYNLTPGFYLLPGARQVYNRIREIQQKSRQ
jgi:hypothetical protein